MIKILNNKKIEIPKALYIFMKKPLFIFIYKYNSDNLWLRSFKISLIFKLLVRIIKGDEFLFAKRIENGPVIYKSLFSSKYKKLQSNYRIINYENKFVIVKSINNAAAIDRENFWKTISDYNEHKELNKQIQENFKRTEWLSDVISSYHPNSVLEIGCGSGRNLYFVKKKNQNCNLFCVEINQSAIELAKKQVGNDLCVLSNSVYSLDKIDSNSIDVVFTSGLLMHIPHDLIKTVVDNIYRISKKVIILYELHGPSHDFDFHRYPRNYSELFQDLNFKYEVFSKNDFRNAGTDSFNHSILILEKK